MAYSKEEAAEKILQAGLELVKKGLIARTWGNISARISDTEFMITPSGMAYDRLTPEDLVICRIEDCSYEGDKKPSSEKGVHGAAYKHRPEVNFVIHTHQIFATAVGAMGKGLSGSLIENSRIPGGRVACGKYAISSTKPLAKNMEAVICRYPECKAFFMRFHGALCLGADYEEAFSVSEELERICRKILDKKLHLDTAPAEEFPAQLNEEKICRAIGEKNPGACILFDCSKPAEEVSWKWDRVYSMIDDMAQIAGASFSCMEPGGASFEERLADALEDKECVFIRGLGAVLTAADPDEAQALRMVLDKNCLAALYCDAHGVREHLAFPDAMLQRLVYKMKYSKLK